MKKIILISALFILVLIEPFLSRERQALRLEQHDKLSLSNALPQLLGELRYTLASYLWLKAEIYHHELGLTDVTSHVGRGDPKKIGELLGICRLVTTLDPGFTQAYDIGSWRLAQGLGKFDKAIQFLDEGIAYNPTNGALYGDKAMIYVLYMKDCHSAIPSLKQWIKLTDDSLQRINGLRILGHCFEHEKRYSEAYKTLEALDALTPHDPLIKQRLDLLRKKIGR